MKYSYTHKLRSYSRSFCYIPLLFLPAFSSAFLYLLPFPFRSDVR